MQDKSNDNETAVQYSLGQPPQRIGLFGLPMATTAVGFVGVMLAAAVMAQGHAGVGFFVILPLTAIVAAIITIRPWMGRVLIEAIAMAVQSWMGRKNSSYVSGGCSRVPGGHHRAPGLLSRVEMAEATDAAGAKFGALIDRPANKVTVIFDTQLTGQIAMTQHERNQATAEWSRWLASLSLAGDVDNLAVVVGTRPGTGEMLSTEARSLVDPEAPAIARQILSEAADAMSIGTPEIVAHVALTLRVDGHVLRSGGALSQIGNRLPALYQALAWAGMLASPMTAEEITARVHQFYNPASEADFEELAMRQEKHGMAWEDAGPSVTKRLRNCYFHDGVFSQTWEMRDGPRATFEDTILQSLIAPHPRVPRKRVCLVYRPYEAGQGASRVEKEHTDALVGVNNSHSVRSARAELRLEHTDAARRAQAKGAQLGRYSLFVTATSSDRESLEKISYEVRHLAAGSSVQLGSMDFQQDAGFQISLGVGQAPWTKQTTSIRP